MSGFGIANIKLKSFLIELKHRDINTDDELTSGFELIQVPDLKDTNLTTNYLLTCVWALLEADYKNDNINQVFVYNRQGEDVILRIETNKFADENPTHYQAPTKEKFDSFASTIKKRVKSLYGAEVENYCARVILPVQSITEYYQFYENELRKYKGKKIVV